MHNQHNHNLVGGLEVPSDLDMHGDQLQNIKQKRGGHKNSMMKKITHILAFPVLCGLTKIVKINIVKNWWQKQTWF